MGYSVDVYDHTFEEEVLEKSYQIPIIVDFFATWCGPCQMLKPILETVAQEYNCVVAKIDIDNNQYLANAYQIEGVPDVKIFREGKVVDGFVGVLPEPQLKALLANCQISSHIEEGLAAVKLAISSDD
jgi:putative thioredoxin